MEQRVEAWHCLPDDGHLVYRRDEPVEPGLILTVEGALRPCAWGLHACERLYDAWGYGHGNLMCRVELGGEIQRAGDKLCARSRKVLWMARLDEAVVYMRRDPYRRNCCPEWRDFLDQVVNLGRLMTDGNRLVPYAWTTYASPLRDGFEKALAISFGRTHDMKMRLEDSFAAIAGNLMSVKRARPDWEWQVIHNPDDATLPLGASRGVV